MKVIGQTDACDFLLFDSNEYYDQKIKVAAHRRIDLDQRASVAIAMVERWGPVVAEPDGVDDAGRQKMRQMDPKDIARRAVDITRALFHEFHIEGWSIDVPSFTEMTESLKKETEKS